VDSFENVTVVKKANIYFDGKVASRTVLFRDGSKKTLGIILPGQYEFGTGDKERMEVLAGSLAVLLPESKDWKYFKVGQVFEIPSNSKFKIIAKEVCDDCCDYIKE